MRREKRDTSSGRRTRARMTTKLFSLTQLARRNEFSSEMFLETVKGQVDRDRRSNSKTVFPKAARIQTGDVLLKSRIWEICKFGSVRGAKITLW